MPIGVDFVDYFDLDKVARIEVDSSPQYPERVIEETDQYKIYMTKWGAVLKDFKQADSTPEFLDYTVTTPEKWQQAKRRMTPADDRIPWDYLRANYGRWRHEGYWIDAKLFFGFDSAHAMTVGFETFLTAMIQQPQWCVDMFNHYLDVSIALQDRVWDAGYPFDSVTWTDDLAYKNGLFFSLDMYRACSNRSNSGPFGGHTPRAPRCVVTPTVISGPCCRTWSNWASTCCTRWKRRPA